SHGCRQVSGEAREQRTRSSVCTKSSSGGSRRRPCCRRQKRQRCCSGRCSPLVRSTCARLMVGRRSPQSPSINRLTSPPDQILSKCRRSRHQIPTPLATAPRLQAGSRHWSEASSNIRAIWHSDELVVWNRPIAPGVHGSSAHLAVPRMPIAGRGLVVGDFIQRPTMGALEGLSHPPSIGAIVLCIHPARARIV